MSKQHDAFLSYSRKDVVKMERVRDALRADGLIIWTDEYLEPGTSAWQRSIEQAIRESKSLIVLLSPDAKDSDWVLREITMAQELGLQIFPMVIEGEKHTDIVPFSLISHQWIDAREQFEMAINSLKQSVLKFVDKKSYEDLLYELNSLKRELEAVQGSFEKEKNSLHRQLEEIQRDNEELQAVIVTKSHLAKEALQQVEQLEKELIQRPIPADCQELRKRHSDLQEQFDELLNVTKYSEQVALPQITNRSTDRKIRRKLYVASWTWSFSIISILILSIITFAKPSIDFINSQFDEYLFSMQPVIHSYLGYILLIINIFLGFYWQKMLKVIARDKIIPVGIMVAFVWMYILFGLLPTGWLGLLSLFTIFLCVFFSHLVTLFVLRLTDMPITFAISFYSMLAGILMSIFFRAYELLNLYIYNNSRVISIDGLLISLGGAFIIGSVLVIVTIPIYNYIELHVYNAEASLPSSYIIAFATIFVTSICLLIWLYQFNGWEQFVA